jgi:ATP-dependent helicase/nuclease subunit A
VTTEEILADQDARQAIESDLATTFLVEAAAGTGKTTSLLKRMVALLREGGARADCMATMTFTRKAAAHLRERFQLALEDAFRSETDELMQSRLALALRHMDRCFIGTIHSFCARLLRERPLEAGVDPDFMELTESEDLAIRRQCWQDYTQHLFVEDSPIPQLLESLGVNLGDLETAYRKMADYPDVTPTCSSLPKPDLDQALEKVSSFLDSVKEDLPRAAPEKGWDDLQDRLRLALQLTQILDLSPYPNRVRLLEALAYEGNVTKRRWPEGWRAAEIKTAYDKLRDTVVRPALGRWREYLHPFLVDVIQPALDDLSSRRLAAGQLNYQDLLISSRDLLRDHPRVRTYFQRRFTHFFVDEFQDTDPVQAEVILYLSSHNGHERDWRKLRPRPGALFMVGDPKQSIYRFRRADIATYDRVKEMIVGGGGGILQLKTNFRSISPICTRINEVFDEILSSGLRYHGPGNGGQTKSLRKMQRRSPSGFGGRSTPVGRSSKKMGPVDPPQDGQSLPIS